VVIRVSRAPRGRHVFASVPLWCVFFLVGAIAFAHEWPPEADSVLRIAAGIAVAAALGVMAVPLRLLEPRWLSEERAAGFPSLSAANSTQRRPSVIAIALMSIGATAVLVATTIITHPAPITAVGSGLTGVGAAFGAFGGRRRK